MLTTHLIPAFLCVCLSVLHSTDAPSQVSRTKLCRRWQKNQITWNQSYRYLWHVGAGSQTQVVFKSHWTISPVPILNLNEMYGLQIYSSNRKDRLIFHFHFYFYYIYIFIERRFLLGNSGWPQTCDLFVLAFKWYKYVLPSPEALKYKYIVEWLTWIINVCIISHTLHFFSVIETLKIYSAIIYSTLRGLEQCFSG